MLLYVYQQLGIIFIPYLTIKFPLIEKIFFTCCPEYPRIPILIIFQQTFQDNLLTEFLTGWSFSDHWRQSVIPAIYYDAYQNLATVKDELCARLVIYVCCPLKDPLPFCVALVCWSYYRYTFDEHRNDHFWHNAWIGNKWRKFP